MSRVNEMVTELPDNAGVRHPPPVPYVLAMLAGALVHRWWPRGARPEGWLPLGVTLVAIGVALMLWAKASFDAKHTPLEPWRSTEALVDSGPYAYSRNPIYLSFALIEVGVGVWADVRAIVLLTVVPMVMTARFVVPREEAYLRRKFGVAYDGYCSRVRRWF